MNKFYTLKQIETPRLIIRPVQLGDEIQLNQAVNNSLESLQQWMPWANDPSLETTRDFIQKGVFAKSSQSIADFPMVVVHKEDQKIISGSGYNDRSDPKNGLYEIGYWCDVDYQGKGYVAEYVNALTKYALEELKAKTVVIRMEVDNRKSIAVAERLNFKNQGTKPSVTKDNATDYYFTCENIELLPPLDFSWSYEENNSNDAKIISWARNALKISDDRVFAESKMLLKTPWSSVMAVNTAAGTVYLKHMPEQIALEADIIKHLKNQFNASVPEVIADNKELSCFLMKDAGISLRSILKKKFNVDLMCEAINQFTKLQISIGNNVEGLLELGVPDWRVDKLTDLFGSLLEQKDLLISDGLSEDEISQLKSLRPKITLMCEKLSSFAVYDTLVQCDFHDNNILFDENTDSFTYIDLGEVVISHPFFSLAGCLWQMHKHYNVKETDDNFKKIQASCFNNFIAVNTEENVLGAFKITKLLWYVYEVLAQYRLIQACDREKIMAFQHSKLSKTLRDFIVICKTFNEK